MTPIRITTAAKLLDLSRTHAIKLMDDGKIERVATGDGTVMVTMESVNQLKTWRERRKEGE